MSFRLLGAALITFTIPLIIMASSLAKLTAALGDNKSKRFIK